MTCRGTSSLTSTCSATPITGAQLGYDTEGRLVSWQNLPTAPTSTARYLYDGEGERVESQVTSAGVTSTTIYVGALEDVATTGSSTTTTTYYDLGDAGLAVSVTSGSLSYLATDHLGSPAVTLDGSGNLTGSQLYAAYGTSAYSSGSMPGSYGYTGQRSDTATTGLDYYGARSYDPVAAQFTSADTVRDGPSPYAYVAGNPETLVDPSGAVACSGSSCQTESGAVDALAEGEFVYQQAQSHPVWLANLFLYQRSLWLMGEAYAEGVHDSLRMLTGEGALKLKQTTPDAYWNSSDAAMQTFFTVNALIDGLLETTTGQTGDSHFGGEGGNDRLGASDGSTDGAFSGDGFAWGETATTDDALTGDDLAARNDEALRDPERGAGGDGGGCSFAAETPVATPTGEQAIGSLQVGEQVTAYDPWSGQTSTQTVQHVWVNHDSDLVDVTLAGDPTGSQPATQQDTSKQQQAAVKSRGLRAPPADDTGAGTLVASSEPAATETVHTTANHPWLSADRGWVPAGQLVVGERVVRADGSTATVAGVRVVPGSGTMYNLTVSHLHTYAVGTEQYVVHNDCPVTSGGGGAGGGGSPPSRPTIKVKDLQPIHTPEVSGARPDLEGLSDEELLQSVSNPVNNDPIRINTRTGRVMDGNGRAYELQRRSRDPRSIITPDTEVPYEPYVPFTPWDM